MAESASASAPQAQGNIAPDDYYYVPEHTDTSSIATSDYNLDFGNGQQLAQPGYYYHNYQQAGGQGSQFDQSMLVGGNAAPVIYTQEEEEEEEGPQQY